MDSIPELTRAFYFDVERINSELTAHYPGTKVVFDTVMKKVEIYREDKLIKEFSFSKDKPEQWPVVMRDFWHYLTEFILELSLERQRAEIGTDNH